MDDKGDMLYRGALPRTARASVGGLCYHVISRGNALGTMLHQADDCKTLSQVLRETTARVSGNSEGVRSYNLTQALL